MPRVKRVAFHHGGVLLNRYPPVIGFDNDFILYFTDFKLENYNFLTFCSSFWLHFLCYCHVTALSQSQPRIFPPNFLCYCHVTALSQSQLRIFPPKLVQLIYHCVQWYIVCNTISLLQSNWPL